MSQQTSLNVVVIGGSSGIGKSIVTRFATSGHNVFATYYSNSKSAMELREKYTNVECCRLDQGDLDSIESFTTLVREWLERESGEGKLDILINNAALGSATVIPYIQSKISNSSGDCKQWDSLSTLRKKALEDEALMRVNALGPLWVTESLLGFMTRDEDDSRRNFATVVFLGSVGGSVSVFPEYRASDLMSKAAVTYLSKHLAAEHVQSNVDIFCLSPGATLTEMFRKSTLDTCSNPDTFTSQMPKKRLIEPDELADAVFIFTTNRWARVFHGAVLDASLGLGIRPGLQTENKTERIK